MFRSRVIRDSIFISPVKITLGKGLSKCDVIEVARGTMADNAVEGKPRPPSMKKGKGKFCCAGNCTNTYLDGVSLHSFPPADKRPDIRRKWIKFIRDEQVNFSSPSKWQFICEKHFTPDSYPMKYRYLKGMGKTIMRKDLNPDAVPTIHLKLPVPESSPCTRYCTTTSIIV